MVSVAMNRYEEFALDLKQADLEWFEENIVYINNDYDQDFLGKKTLPKLTKDDLKGNIRKDLALEVFNRLYTNQQVNNMTLGKYLPPMG